MSFMDLNYQSVPNDVEEIFENDTEPENALSISEDNDYDTNSWDTTDTYSDDSESDQTDSCHWNEIGFSKPYFPFYCSVHVGSFHFTPHPHVLFGAEGFSVQAPVLNLQKNWIGVIGLKLPIKHLLQVEAHFDQKLLVLFLDFTPILCSRISAELHLREISECWDPFSVKESQRRLILLPSCSLDCDCTLSYFKNCDCSLSNVKNAVENVFKHGNFRGKYREIMSSDEAHKMLISSL